MILRGLITVIFCYFFSVSAFAQTDMEDVVYLKNGGVTRGTIIEFKRDTTLKIQTKERNIFVYTFEEIDKVVREPVAVKEAPVQTPIKETPTPASKPVKAKAEFKQEGFHNITKAGPFAITTYSVNFINGYQFNPHLLLGLGVGLDTYQGLTRGTVLLPFTAGTGYTDFFLPIFMDFRYHVSESRATFLIFLDMGYSIYLKRKINNVNPSYSSNSYYYSDDYLPNKGGTFFCPGIGLKVFLSKNVGVVMDFGMKIQNYSSSGTNYSGVKDSRPGLAVGPVLNFGLAF
jgi:hypothetical protein